MKKDMTNGTPKKEGRLEKVIVTLLVVLVSLLSFSVGVISGKGLSDKEYALKSLDKKSSHVMTDEENDGETTEVAGSGELSEEELQQLAKSAIENAEGEKKEGDATAHNEAATEEHKDVAAAPKQEKAKISEEERSPSSINKKAAELDYTVQVASYADIKDAELLAGNLIKKGYPAFPFKTEINGKTWYRVSVGSFKNKKEAMEYQTELAKQGVVKDSIVQKLTH